MFTCHGCTRHVVEGTRTCPFCGVSLRAGVSPISGGFVGALLGLALYGCGDPDPGDEEGASSPATTASSSTGSSMSTGNATTTDPGSEAEAADYGTAEPPADSTSSTGGTGTGTTTAEESEAEGADYAGPPGDDGDADRM